MGNVLRMMTRLWAIIMTINYYVLLETKGLIMCAYCLFNLSEVQFSAEMIEPKGRIGVKFERIHLSTKELHLAYSKCLVNVSNYYCHHSHHHHYHWVK